MLLFLGFAAAALAPRPPQASAQITYVERASELGVSMVWAESFNAGDFGTGVALEDYDHDGDVDIFVGTKAGEPLAVYRREGAVYQDVGAGLDLCSDVDVKQVLFADLDNDGWRDLVLSVWRPSAPGNSQFLDGGVRVYRAGPGGAFTRIVDAALDSATAGLPTGVTAGDFDLDGDLDLYVGMWRGGTPDPTSRNRLLMHDGAFGFADRGADLGVDSNKKSFQAVFTDLSGDGWPDIVVAQDKRGGMTYYESDGAGGFTDRTVESGLDGYLSFTGDYIDGMGIAVGDADRDGDLDLYSTNIFDGNVYYRNNGNGTFTEVARQNGTVSLRIGWGCAFLDCDNDGYEDLYVVDFGTSGNGDALDRLYRNGGNAQYVDVAQAAGITLNEDGFGLAAGDLDLDGAVDLVITHSSAPVRIWMNENTGGNALALELVGTASNRDAVGAKVEVWTGGQRQFFEQRAGESYLGSHTHALEVGLGTATAADSVVVRWPAGEVERWTDLAAGEQHVLREGGTTVPVLLPPAVAPAEWAGAGLLLRWELPAGGGADRFTLYRVRDGEQEMLTTLLAQPGRSRYAFTDPGDGIPDFWLLETHYGEAVVTSEIRLSPAAARPALAVAPAFPNPFNPRVTIRFRNPGPGAAEVRLFDLRGRLVNQLAAPSGTGWQSVIWDGTDFAGRPVASGKYFAEIRSAGQRRAVPLTAVR